MSLRWRLARNGRVGQARGASAGPPPHAMVGLREPRLACPTLRSMRTILAMVFICAMPSVAFAQTSYPMLMSLKPLAVQIGATTECEVSARYNLFGAYQVFV